jgi:hypothetical protein
MPYFCYIHNGLYVKGEEEGCQDKYCLEFKELDVPPVGIMFGAVPGGTTKASLARTHSDKFHKDMYAYEDARKQGVEPEQVSAKAAQKALKAKEKEVA